MRVLLVGRHFWPHGTLDAAAHLIHLATGMRRAGVHVEVLTPKFSNRWAHRFEFREFTVHRPVTVAKNDWGMNRYIRQMTQWIQTHGGAFDAIWCDGAREESLAVLGAARRLQVPTIVRVAGRGAQSDVVWWKTTRTRRRCETSLAHATRILVSAPSAHRALVASGFHPDQLVRLESGIPATPAFSGVAREKERQRARVSLASINSDLFAPPETKVLLLIGRLQEGRAASFLVDHAMPLLNQVPGLAVWIVGDGARRETMHRRLRGDGVRDAVAIPGSFGNPEDLFLAADVYLQLDDGGMDAMLPSAIGHGLPIVAWESPTLREYFARDSEDQSDVHAVTWFEESNRSSFVDAVQSVVKDLPEAERKAERLRQRRVREHSSNEFVQQVIAMIRRLSAESSMTVDSDGRSGTENATDNNETISDSDSSAGASS